MFKDEVAGQVATYDSDVDSSDIEFASVHGLIDDDPVTISGDLPDEFSINTIYYINYIDTDTIQLALYPDGASITMAGSQDGSITLTPADHLITYQNLHQLLDHEMALWRHKDGFAFMVAGVDDPNSITAETEYCKFRFESFKSVYLTGEHGTEYGLHLMFKSVDYVHYFWNAGAF